MKHPVYEDVQFGVNTSTRNTTRAKLYDKMEAGIMYVD
jgi:hypothetical protein